MKRKIEIFAYDDQWPERAREEGERIRKALGPNCIAVHHIGSTSVPGLAAKPILDLLPVVRDLEEVSAAQTRMEGLGYRAMGEYGIAFRRYFQKGGEARTHNVHVYEKGNPEIDRHLRFRDWLREHPEDAAAYGRIKIDLAEKFPESIYDYSVGKSDFVSQIDAKSGYEGWRLVEALTPAEWEAVQRLSGRAEGVDGRRHMVFYCNLEIVGYVELEIVDGYARIVQLLDGGQTLLERLIKRWVKLQGLKLHSSK